MDAFSKKIVPGALARRYSLRPYAIKSPDLSGSLLSKKGSYDLWLCPLGIKIRASKSFN